MKKTLGETSFIMYYLWEKIDKSMGKFFQYMQNQNNNFISEFSNALRNENMNFIGEFFKKQRIENKLLIIRLAKTMGYEINMEDFKEELNYSR